VESRHAQSVARNVIASLRSQNQDTRRLLIQKSLFAEKKRGIL
jgi:hypothetical protein